MEMDARRSYEALLLGRLSRDYGSEYLKIRRRVIATPDLALIESGALTEDDELILAQARDYAAKSARSLGEGPFQSVYDLLLWLESVDTLHGPDTMTHVYRGHRDARWRLVPSLFRDDRSLRSTERLRGAASTIVAWASRRGLSLDPTQTVAILQHYGIPTPFLDFTKNIRIAAAFACAGYLSGDSVERGKVFRISLSDCSDFMPVPGTALGNVRWVDADFVPRIKAQQALFFGGFKTPALEQLAGISSYEFLHGPSSEDFANVVGLSQAILFPESDELAGLLNDGFYSSCPDQCAPVDDAIRKIDEDQSNWGLVLTAADYLEMVQGWINCDALSATQQTEIRVLAHWFWLVQNTDLPPLCKALHLLWQAVTTIEIDPYAVAEDSTDIEGRLMASGRAGATEMVFELFRRARTDLDGLFR